MCKQAKSSEIFEDGKGKYQHCRPQTDYTHTPDGISVCTYVVHQENINEEVPPILQKYGCEVDRMPRLNASTKKK